MHVISNLKSIKGRFFAFVKGLSGRLKLLIYRRKKIFLAGGGLIFILLLIIFGVLFVQPFHLERTDIEANQTDCVEGNFFIPSFYKAKTQDFHVFFKDKFSIGEIDLFARKICFQPIGLLDQAKNYDIDISYAGDNIVNRKISVKVLDYPKIISDKTEKTYPINSSIDFNLDKQDGIFSYFLVVFEKDRYAYKIAKCNVDDNKVICGLSALGLKQGGNYNFKLDRKFSDEDNIILELPFKTIDAMVVTQTLIKDGETVKGLNPQITIEFNKEINKLGTWKVEKLGQTNTPIEFDSKVEANKITLQPKTSLDPESDYQITINDLTAKDKAYLESPFALKFKSDSGPHYVSSNLSAYKFPPSGKININYDKNLNPKQNLASLISLSPSVAYNIAVSGGTVTLSPKSSLGSCVSYTLTIKSGLMSEYDIPNKDATTIHFKTTCARTAVIGYSQQGRAIISYTFGTGPKKILYFGAIHGSESNTQRMLLKWVDELEINSANIPSDKTIIVVPSTNPDGVARGTRLNSRNVDLNRNFPASNWQKDVYFTGGVVYVNGGGSEPFSESESRTIRDLMYAQSPYLTMTYHSAAAYVIPNGTGASYGLAQRYANLSRYTYVPDSSTGQWFDYSITGDFDTWAKEKGYNVVLVELASAYSDEFSRNKAAMWDMAKQ